MILYDAEQIRQKIQSVLKDQNGKRYAIVAFIGQDVLDFIQNPDGLTVYCWPNVVATHPDGISNLISKGAIVYFVDRLHVKLLWSTEGGAVLGSCNLTQNALGGNGNGLYELAYFVKDSSQVAVDEVISKFRKKREKVTPKVLAAYRRKYNAAAARRDEYVASPKKADEDVDLPTFGDYLARSERRRWSVNTWSEYGKIPGGVLDAIAEYEEKEGLSKEPARYFFDTIECNHKPQTGEWVLCCYVGNDYGRLAWVYNHVAARPRKNSKLWNAVQLKKKVELPPFDCKEQKFVKAFHEFARDIDLEDSFVMTEARMRKLAKHYGR